MPDVSPPWWNLGHTSWFFAKNVLEPFGAYSEDDARSWSSSSTPTMKRSDRASAATIAASSPGRPTTRSTGFRESVDARMEELIRGVPDADLERLAFLVLTGVQHEQQHQELLVTEVKHILGYNVARAARALPPAEAAIEARRPEAGWSHPGRPPRVRQPGRGLVLGQRGAGPQGLARRLRPPLTGWSTRTAKTRVLTDGGSSNPRGLSNGWANPEEAGPPLVSGGGRRPRTPGDRPSQEPVCQRQASTTTPMPAGRS